MADPKNTPPADNTPPVVAPAESAAPQSLAEQQAAAEAAAQVTTANEAELNEVKLPKVGAKVAVRPVYGPMRDITTDKEIPQTEDGVRLVVTPWINMQIAAKKLAVVD